MLGDYGPLVNARRPWATRKQEGIGAGRKKSAKSAHRQAEIDRCVERCPWPDMSGMCDACRGHPERIESYTAEDAGSEDGDIRCEGDIPLAVLWLEWRARDPDNPRPERTREILTMLRRYQHGK